MVVVTSLVFLSDNIKRPTYISLRNTQKGVRIMSRKKLLVPGVVLLFVSYLLLLARSKDAYRLARTPLCISGILLVVAIILTIDYYMTRPAPSADTDSLDSEKGGYDEVSEPTQGEA